MGFYYEEPAQITARRRGVTRTARATTKIRVASGGLGSIQTLIASRLPGVTPAPTTSGQQSIQNLINSRLPGATQPAPTPISFRIPTTSPTPAGAFISPTSTQPKTFSPATAPTPTPTPTTTTDTVAPAPARTFSPTSSPPPASTPSDPSAPALPPAQETSPAGVVGTGATSGSGATYDAPTTIRFDSSPALMPNASGGPEIYNEDGTPVTPAAQTATFTEKLKNLPALAKIGGAALAYLLLHG